MEANYEDLHYVMANIFKFNFRKNDRRLRYELAEEDIVFLLPVKSHVLPKIRTYHVNHIADVLWQRGLLKEKKKIYKLIESSKVLKEEALV